MSRPIGTPFKRASAVLAEPEAASESEAPPRSLLLGLGGGLLVSAAVLFIATQSWLVALAFVLGSSVLLGGVLLLDRVRAAPTPDSLAAPDWSVTVAAIERKGEAIAITDRANRMVCANVFFLDKIGRAHV